MTLRVKYTASPARGVWRMAVGFAALLAVSCWALNLQIAATALEVEHRLIALVVGGHLSGWLFLSGFHAGRRMGSTDQAPVTSPMVPAVVIQRAA